MSEENAAIGLKAIIGVGAYRPMRGGTKSQAVDGDYSWGSVRPFAVQYWAKRVMWAFVIATSLCDIAVTFDTHFSLLARLF